jgi:hypothetical protein
MSKWIISIPAWGGNYVAEMLRLALPSAAYAGRRMGWPIHFICHTNCPDVLSGRVPEGWTCDVRTVGDKPTYVTLQESHADAVASAEPGDRVLLLNADLVVSGNMLEACHAHFDAGKLAVVLTGIRTVKGDETPPIGAPPRDLLAWAWAHRHRIISDLEWTSGRSMLPTNLFFEHDGAVCARGFHLHPVAIVKREDTSFRSTIDGDLLDCFPRDKIHVVTSPDDCSMLEVSPASRRFPVGATGLTPLGVVKSMKTRASDTHCWLFTHRLGVVGDYEGTDDEVVANEILALMDKVVVSSRAGRDQRGREPHGRRGR